MDDLSKPDAYAVSDPAGYVGIWPSRETAEIMLAKVKGGELIPMIDAHRVLLGREVLTEEIAALRRQRDDLLNANIRFEARARAAEARAATSATTSSQP